MSPWSSSRRASCCRFPGVSGDEPGPFAGTRRLIMFSLRERG